jgi:hypothetical protein
MVDQYARIKGLHEQDAIKHGPTQLVPNALCFLGLIFEAHIQEYELDVYAYISATKYKYVLIKND